MSREAEHDDNPSKLKRAIIDHMVITMVASVVSCFFFLVWHLYSRLESRVAALEKETSAALLVLKESSIEHKVRLDMLERDFARRSEPAPVVATAAPASTPVVTAVRPEVPLKADVGFWAPPVPRTNYSVQQQSQQQQAFPMSAPPELIQQRSKPLADIQAAREELQKKIRENFPSSKP